jgi:hypothetical protein
MANPNQAQRNPQNQRDEREQMRKPEAAQQAPNQQNPNQKPQMGGDQGKVGQDTDGDGKVVKPGQTPGQSHGKGLDNTGKPNANAPGNKSATK